MRIISFLFIVISISSCGTTGSVSMLHPKRKNAGNLEIDQLTEVSKKDQMFAIHVEPPFIGSMKFSPTNLFAHVCAPLSIKTFYHHARFGEVYGQYTYPLYDKDFHSQNDPEVTEPKSRSEYQFHYSLPVFNKVYTNKRFGMQIEPDVSNAMKYTGLFPCAVNTKINLVAGIQHTFHIHTSYAFAHYMAAQGQEDIINNVPVPIEQVSNNFKAGISFQSFINTRIICNGEGKTFKGYLSRITTLYVNALCNLKNSLSPVDYYNYGYAYTIDFTPYLVNIPIGYSVGFSATNKFWNTGPISSYGFEFGLSPGSYDKSSDGLYFTYTMGIGIGMVRPKSSIVF